MHYLGLFRIESVCCVSTHTSLNMFGKYTRFIRSYYYSECQQRCGIINRFFFYKASSNTCFIVF